MADWTGRFLDLAEHVSMWSKDPSIKVGAVIADDHNRIVSLGFNGFPRGVADDDRLHDRETKYRTIVHAETNALLNARSAVDGCTIYVHPFMPCTACALLLIQAGVTKIVAPFSDNPRWKENFTHSQSLFQEAGVHLCIVARGGVNSGAGLQLDLFDLPEAIPVASELPAVSQPCFSYYLDGIGNHWPCELPDGHMDNVDFSELHLAQYESDEPFSRNIIRWHATKKFPIAFTLTEGVVKVW